ncbi:MAG TPA: amidohydrolase family protein [Puia sp.]|nr:amidohydrolase family protein [Puia sp.]
MRTILTLFIAGLAVFANAQIALPAYALTNVQIIDAGHRTPLARQTILVRGGVIDQVFPDGSRQLPDSVPVMDMRERYIIPGLIDTHVHLATDPSGVDNRTATLNVLSRMLYSGITSVRDMAGDARVLAGLSRDAGTGEILSPDIYYSALMAGPDFFTDPRTVVSTRGGVAGRMPFMQAVSDSTQLPLAIAAAKGTGATGIKLYADLSGKEVAAIVAEAHRQGIKVWGHAWLFPAIPSDLVRAGVGSLSHAPLMAGEMLYRPAFGNVPDAWKKAGLSEVFWRDSVAARMDVLFKLMKQHNTLLDATMITYQRWAQSDSSMLWDYELTKRVTAAAYKAGVKICAGTDDDQEQFVQYEIKLLVKDAGFSPIDALISATQYGAEAIGIEGTHGMVAAGKVADLVVLDKNPLADLDNLDAVYLVVKGGKMLSRRP